ncbi:hypothetical protein K7432_014654, partial [Basidiobolus ranarum]
MSSRRYDSERTTSPRAPSSNTRVSLSPGSRANSSNHTTREIERIDVNLEHGFDAAPQLHSSYIQDALSHQESTSPTTSKRPNILPDEDRPLSTYNRRQTGSYSPRITTRPPGSSSEPIEKLELQTLQNHVTPSDAYNSSINEPSHPRQSHYNHSIPRNRNSKVTASNPREVSVQGRSEPPRRKRSLVRPERRPERRYTHQNSDAAKARGAARGAREELMNRAEATARESTLKDPPQPAKKRRCPSCWVIFSRIVTFYAPSPILSCCGMKTPDKRQAWREKIALCTIIFLLCSIVGFLTFGLQQVLCGLKVSPRVKQGTISSEYTIINGRAYKIAGYSHPGNSLIPQGGDITSMAGAMDISLLFQSTNKGCNRLWGLSNANDAPTFFPCVIRNSTSYPGPTENTARTGCHLNTNANTLRSLPLLGDVYYQWKDIQRKDRNLVVYNGHVLDVDLLNSLVPNYQSPPIYNKLRSPNSPYRGTDVTYLLGNYHRNEADCAAGLLKVGLLDTTSMGCLISNIILYISLIVILGVVLSKFVLAVFFGWVISWRLGSFRQETYEERMKRVEAIEKWSENPNNLA